MPLDSSWLSPGEGLSYVECRSKNFVSLAFYSGLLWSISRIHQFLKLPVDIGSAAEVAQMAEILQRFGRRTDAWVKEPFEDTSEGFLF